MGIQIVSAISQPQVTYDKVFLRRLTIDQVEVIADAPPPKYKVFVEYRLYGVVNGIRHFHPDIREVEVADFIQEAMKEAQEGDPTLLNAMPTIEAAIARLVAIDLVTQAEVV